MNNDGFILRFIRQLRASEMRALPMNCAERLATHLEMRMTNPCNDGFDISLTGNEEQDRSILAAWLEGAADAGPYLAPSWGRNFSEALAWLLRNKHDVSIKGVTVAAMASLNPEVARMANEHGVEAAYAALSERSKRR